MTTNETFDRFVDDLRAAVGDASTQMVVVRSTASTNELARQVHSELVDAGLPTPGATIFAYEQTAGRGRRGRSWRSAAGLGVYATTLSSLIDEERLAAVPLIAAASLCRTLQRYLGDRCGVEWPNDLVVEGRKLGGVLVEARGGAEGGQMVAVGFGVNHGHDDDTLPMPRATSCRRELVDGEIPTLGSLAWELAARLLEDLEDFDRERAVKRFRDCLVHERGDEIRFRRGEELVEGSFRGVDAEGHLRLELDDGSVRVVASGEIVQ